MHPLHEAVCICVHRAWHCCSISGPLCLHCSNAGLNAVCTAQALIRPCHQRFALTVHQLRSPSSRLLCIQAHLSYCRSMYTQPWPVSNVGLCMYALQKYSMPCRSTACTAVCTKASCKHTALSSDNTPYDSCRAGQVQVDGSKKAP